MLRRVFDERWEGRLLYELLAIRQSHRWALFRLRDADRANDIVVLGRLEWADLVDWTVDYVLLVSALRRLNNDVAIGKVPLRAQSV